MKRKYLFILLLILLQGCVQESKQVVEAYIEKFTEPVSLEVTPGADLGEIALDEGTSIVTIKIRNNSSEIINNLKLTLDPTQNVLQFATSDTEEGTGSPGAGGTCGSELAPKEECLYVLSLTHSRAGKFNIPVTFDYVNLIKPAQKTFAISALVGEAASLVFTNEISKYDLGVIEQTEPITRELNLEVKNMGGLNARNLILSFINDAEQTAFSVLENHCPSVLGPLETCSIKIGYVPKNNEYSDPEIVYSSHMIMSYYKDPLNRMGKLNGYFNFRSSTIEAKFDSSYKFAEFSQLVTGNQESKTIRVTNVGYNNGVVKYLQFYSSIGELLSTCQKENNQALLVCHGRSDFPFLIEEITPCLDQEIKGVEGKVPGGSCTFKVTYWPKRYYAPGSQLLHDFNASSISLVYDSRWRNLENIVTKNGMFAITANFVAGGKLSLQDVLIDDVSIGADNLSASYETLWEANLGRLAKISDASFKSIVKIIYKNIGEYPVSLVNIKDGAISPHYASEVSSSWNSYYTGVKHVGCESVPPGGTCSISFSLTPLVQATSALEDSLMFDDVSNILKKFKRLIFTFKDGSTFDDDGQPATDSNFELRLIAKLIAKGVLTLGMDTLTIPTVYVGATGQQILNLKNIGTGDIYAISYDDTRNFIPTAATDGCWPFRWVPVGTIPLPATKDCYSIIYPVGSPTSSDTPNVSRVLRPGESCAFALELKTPDTCRLLNSSYTVTKNIERVYSSAFNGTPNMWGKWDYGISSQALAFKYWDGDANAEDVTTVPSPVPFGYLKTSKELLVSGTFYSPPFFVFKNPLPSTSALLVRPALNVPTVSTTYPNNKTLSAYNIVQSFFESSYFTSLNHIFNSSVYSSTHYNTLGLNYTDFVYHMGTFPVGTTVKGQFNFFNISQMSAKDSTFTDELPAGSPLKILSFNGLQAPYPTVNIPAGVSPLVSLEFTPTETGLFEHCLHLEHDNRLGGTTTQRICALAEAVANYAKLKVEYQDITVEQDPVTGSITETPTGVWTTLAMPLNDIDSTNGLVSFSAIRDSAVYALKKIRITNIGDMNVTKFNYSLLASPGTPAPAITEFKLRNSTCGANATIAVGANCTFEYQWKPVTSTVATYNVYGGMVYDLQSGLNQFVSQTFKIIATSVDPASVVMNKTGTAIASITSWSNPAIPVVIPKSWPVDLLAYSDSAWTTHMLLQTKPTTKTISNIPFKNTSTMKASFLAMNPTPAAGTWNSIYSDANVTIQANRYCFYGDDEFNAAIPADEKGFNSLSTNVCMMNVIFKGDYTFQTCNATTKAKTVIMGGLVQDSCNPFSYPLSYYSYKRTTQSKVYIHMKGFIEPNRMLTSANSYPQILSSSSGTKGTIKLTWPTLTAQTPAWGTVTKYRVYYSLTPSDLYHSNIFYKFSTTPNLTYVETASTTYTFTGLSLNKYYYFRVGAVRQYVHPTWGTLNYVSIPSRAVTTLPIQTVPVPDTSTVYDHPTRKLIDKTYLGSRGTRTAGIAACAAKKYVMTISGTSRNIVKNLISSSDWIYLNANPSASTGYPLNDKGVISHWLSDGAYDLKSSITLQDGTVLAGFPSYDPTTLKGIDTAHSLIYSKSCNNSSSCDLLYKMVGGDGVDLFYNGTSYTYDNGISGYYRCSAVILCPTNVSKVITDASCSNP